MEEERINKLEKRVEELELEIVKSEARMFEHFKAFTFVVKQRLQKMERAPECVPLPHDDE